MALINWGVDYFTGLPDVDRQHEELFALINRLHEAKKHRADILDQAFVDLRDYVRDHFAIEEKLMVEANVEAAHRSEHLAAHAAFATRLDELWRRRIDGSEIATEELLDFLAGWLRLHILHTDRKMALEVHARMGTQAPHNMFAHF